MKEEYVEVLKVLFDNNADCYADTRQWSDDTIPCTAIEGETINAMTFEAFKKVCKASSSKGIVGDEKVFSLVDWDEVFEKYIQDNRPINLPDFLKENYNLIKK